MDWGRGGRLTFPFYTVCDLRHQQQKSPHPVNPNIIVCPATVEPRGQVLIKKKNKVVGQGQVSVGKTAQESILPGAFTEKIMILGVSRSQKVQDGIVRCVWKFHQTSRWWHLQNCSYCELSTLLSIGFHKVSNLHPNHPTLYEKGSWVSETQRTGQKLSYWSQWMAKPF